MWFWRDFIRYGLIPGMGFIGTAIAVLSLIFYIA